MSAQKPTVVLVHGAFADSSSWNGVVERLQAHGHYVVSASNPLRGLRTDSDYVRQLVESIAGPVVLVGHSYGGSVISNAARGLDQVKALVYVAGFLPDEGESAVALSEKFPGSTLGETLRPVPIALSDGSRVADLYIEESKFHQQFAADVPETTAAVMAATQRPVADAALAEGASAPAWRDIPSWVLVATKDRNIPARVQIFMAERAKATVVTVDASHAVAVSRPGHVARFVDEAVKATG
ncbi:alpha/beta hydrolase [Streptomyces spiroverticillatus]|uniref:Alpha/beta hydrolase n=1 Tax=Streptomyces finlayi TaxID=67296 RepID=A0A919CC77_9ACTN|nr:alpha/beta hydrolase [Streptomyces finlayi]GHA21517.1 alpha/beta hydrolase [Streptomyces spiroverticillatus]GHD03873.1 alpha/beta hydrolase [Streptomyces finlayi]